MPRTPEMPLDKHVVRLREGDYEFLKRAYPKTSAAVAIRKIVAAHVDNLQSQMEAAAPAGGLEIPELTP